MVFSGPRQSFGITSLLFSGYALFPDIVMYASKTELAYLFDHYAIALNAEYPNKATRVKAEF